HTSLCSRQPTSPPPPVPSPLPYTTLFRSRPAYDLSTNLGGNVAPMAIGNLIAPGAGAVAMGVVSGAGALRDAMRQGYSYGEALRSEEHTSERQSRFDLVCRLLLDKKNGHRFVRDQQGMEIGDRHHLIVELSAKSYAKDCNGQGWHTRFNRKQTTLQDV